ncbi:hypocretin neuropeptide precursor [Synchiropus picturatus]
MTSWLSCDFVRDAGTRPPARKVLALVLMLLLSQLACDAHSVSECCRHPTRSCRLYVLLCRPSGQASAVNDASAGILTLGKRTEDEQRLQSRLHMLLHGSRNQAAGILTMGRRDEEQARGQYMDWVVQSGPTVTTPLPAQD